MTADTPSPMTDPVASAPTPTRRGGTGAGRGPGGGGGGRGAGGRGRGRGGSIAPGAPMEGTVQVVIIIVVLLPFPILSTIKINMHRQIRDLLPIRRDITPITMLAKVHPTRILQKPQPLI